MSGTKSQQSRHGGSLNPATRHQTGEMEHRGLRDIIADRNYTGSEAAWECFRAYARERPEVVALWTFGIGFVLGWKLKIW